MKLCPFCTKSEQDAYLESDNFLVIYNIAPILPGHSLVIPRKHKESLFDLTEQELAEFILLGRKAAKVIGLALKTDSFDWAIQEKAPAGQTVPHLHMHVIPRKFNDLPDPGDWFQELEENNENIDSGKRRKLSREEMESIVKKLKTIANK
ncbi:MAG: HIT family protein [Cytophagaceae bacterium]